MSAQKPATDGGRTRSATERVAYDIRAHMEREKLQPGDRLGREEDLARQFGVSRPTLREGLRLLSSAHLIRASKGPGGGIFVASTPADGIARVVSENVAAMLAANTLDLRELLETRMIVEVPLAGLAAQRATKEDVAALRDILDQGRAAVAADTSVRMIDRDLHRVIVSVARNTLAGSFMAWIVDVLHPSLESRLEHVIVRAAVVELHEAIVEAIERADATAAERAVREWVLYLRDLLDLVNELEAQPVETDPSSTPPS